MKQGNGLKRGGFKTKGTALKSSSLGSGKKRIRQSTSKKRAQNKEYSVVCREILEERGAICEGCGTHVGLSFSHLVSRKRNEKLIAVKENIHIHCMDGENYEGCHSLYETGKWSNLLDRERIIETLGKLDNEYLQIKLLKNE